MAEEKEEQAAEQPKQKSPVVMMVIVVVVAVLVAVAAAGGISYIFSHKRNLHRMQKMGAEARAATTPECSISSVTRRKEFWSTSAADVPESFSRQALSWNSIPESPM